MTDSFTLSSLEALISSIGPLDEVALAAARSRQSALTKPPGSLGRLETLSVQIAGITGQPIPVIQHKVILTMAGDHGVVAERVGAFGLSGGVLLLLLKYTALVAVALPDVLAPSRAAILVLAPTLGRWAISLVVVTFPYARPEGLGKAIKDRAGPAEILLATLFSLGVAGLAVGWLGLVAILVAGLTGWGLARFALARVPGLTGDLYGATCEIVEVVTLLLFALTLKV